MAFSADLMKEQRDKVEGIKSRLSMCQMEVEALNNKLNEAKMRFAHVALEERIESGVLLRMEEINGEKHD